MPAPDRAALPLWAALVLAFGAGPVLDAGFPDRGWWPFTFIGIGLVLISLIGRSVASSLLVGFIAGLSFYLAHIDWAALFLGPLPMTALATLESLFFALGAAAIALAYRCLPQVWPGALGRLGLLPAVIAGIWTGREALASVWPYGGFAWGRVALSQTEGPFASLFSLLGFSGVSFAMVFIVAVIIESIRFVGVGRWARATFAVAVVAILLALPAWPVHLDGSMRVAAVQGNGKAGYFDRRAQGDLLQAQLTATRPIINEGVDVVLWPEGGSDIDPLTSEYAAKVFDYVSTTMNAPLVSGVITQRDGLIYNSSLLWMPGEGEVDIYDKRHPIPFGEYVPDRTFWRPFAPDLIDLIGRDYTPGNTDAVFDINGILAGVNICFDISDDQLLTESVEDGAQLIFAQSNNADFGRTDESVQQLAIGRARARELGRSVVVISTVGTSAIITPDGSTMAQLEWFTADAMIADVPLSTTATPALLLGRQIEWFVSGLALAALGIALFAVRGTRRG